jgi:membrane fusion protein (multidrug efflux system)
MYKKILAIAITAVVFAACSNKQVDAPLAQKQAELDKLLKEQTELNDKVSKLRNEIQLMDTASANQKKIKTVEVTKAALADFKHYIDAFAMVESDQNTLVTAKVPGFVINAILVKQGDNVRTGQLLATVDNSTLVQQLETIKVQLALAQTAYERQKNLWDKKIGSELQYLNAKTQKEAAEKSKAGMEAQLANTSIYAPFDGTIDIVNFKVGDNTMNFSPSQNVGGIRVVNNSRLKITAKLADTYVNKVRAGNKVKVVIPDMDNKEFDATVSSVSNAISDKRTFDIQVLLTNNSGLKPNMQANIKINDASLTKVFVVNENLVQNSEGQKSVYILAREGDKLVARRVSVTTGLSYGGQVVVTGLKEGDEIITTGYANINDGEEVKM